MKLSTQILLAFFIIILLSATNSFVNYRLSKKVEQNSQYLATSEIIIRNSGALHKTIIEMQSAFRGYLLTDEEIFLIPYYSGIRSVAGMFKNEESIVQSSGSQKQKLLEIKELHRQWIDYADMLIAAKRQSLKATDKGQAYRDLFNTRFRKQFGQKLNNAIAVKFREFDRYEYKIRQSRRAMLGESIRNTNTFSLVFMLITIVIGLVSTVIIVLIISRRIKAMVNLAGNISSGNFVTIEDSKNDELTALSLSLNQMSGTLSRNIKELEVRNKELNQFAYVVSHDLKAPIRGIYNVIQWIQEDMGKDLSDEMKKYLGIIPDRIARMEGLIDGLLDYARISRDQAPVEQVDVGLLVNQIVSDLVPVNFQVSIDGMPTIRTEKLRLEQVFSNLISNAVKYASPDKALKKIDVKCANLGGKYEFTVRDNGIGIKSEYYDRIFVIFQTLRERHDKESTGVGLAIVKKIIDDQHCSIRVVSKPGEGSEFIFTWPKN